MTPNKPLTIYIDNDGLANITCSGEYVIIFVDILKIKDSHGKSEIIETLIAEINQKCILYKINISGYYFAKAKIMDGFGNKYNVECSPTLFIEKERQDEIDNILISKNKKLEKIPYFLSPHPQIDFLVDLGVELNENKQSDIRSITGIDFHINFLEIGKQQVKVYSSKPFIDSSCAKEIFSGYAWCDGSFFFGQDAWFKDDTRPTKELHNNLGNYTYLKASEAALEIGTDYLGFSRLFYYNYGNNFFISNRYHLLLLYVKASGLPLKFDWKRIENLFLSNVTLFRQVMTHDLLVDCTHLLPSYKLFRYSHGKIKFEDTPLYDMLAFSVDFEEDKYVNIVRNAATEIKENIRATLNSPDFDRVIVDLSGGRDSRVGYAALTNIEKNLVDKVSIRSTLHEPDDLNTAIQVNNVFRYRYNDEGDIIEPIEPIIGLKNKRSYYLGYHFLWYCPVMRYQRGGQIRITGESFEALSVRYYSNILKNPCETLDINALVSEFSKILSRQCVLDFQTYGHQFSKQLAEGLEAIPGNSAQEKFDSLFLLFRGSFHAGNLDRMYYEPACCMPLQSKNLILAKRMWQSYRNYNRVIYDITYLLNPILSIVPYNSKKTNAEFISYRDNMLVGKGVFSSAYLNTLSTDISDWDDACNRKKSKDSILHSSDALVDSKMLVGENDHVRRLIREQFENNLSALYSLRAHFPEKWHSTIFIPLYWYVNDFTLDSDEARVCHHKISAIFDIAAIIFEE